jgi:CheY-like chemotaxis protein
LADLDVVIADDNAIARDALRMTSAQLGWNATMVTGGRGAMEEVLRRRTGHAAVDLVLLDWQMPDMDGLEAARAIRWAPDQASDAAAEPIVVMVTAYNRERLQAQPDSALADAVLTKPVTASALHDTVARVLQQRAGPAGRPPVVTSDRLQGLHLLVVDDSLINREVAQHILRNEGARVSLAVDGRQALDWLREHGTQVDVVLMDVQMPVMDGYEACREIRRTPALSSLPVVALTAGALPSQQEAALAAGMDDFIAKPFDVNNAVALIRRVARQHPVPQELTPARPVQEPQAVTPPAEREAQLPGLALTRGLRIWKSRARYAEMLRRFAREHGDDVQRIGHAPHAQAIALAHKLKGVAGNLGLDGVMQAAVATHEVLHTGGPATPDLAVLQVAMDTALAAIRRYVGDEPEAAVEVEPEMPADPQRLAPLMAALLEAWERDDPDAVTPVLAELAGLLPGSRLAPLRAAVQDYDFPGGKAATRVLAQSLGIPLPCIES